MMARSGWAMLLALCLLGGCDKLLGLGEFMGDPGTAPVDADGGRDSSVGGQGAAGGADEQLSVSHAHAWGGRGADKVQAMAADGDTLWLAGAIDGAVDFGGGAVGTAGQRRLFLLALDQNGEHVFSRASDQPSDADVVGLAVSNGRIALAGRSVSGGSPFGPLQAPSDARGFATVLDEDGTVVSQLLIGGASTQLNALVQLNGNLVLAGSTEGVITVNGVAVMLTPAGGSEDGFVLGLTNAGGVTFVRRLGGTGIQRATTMVTADQNLYVAGGFAGTLSGADQPLVSSGDSDIFVLKLNAQGDVLASQSFGGVAGQLPTALAVDADSVWLTGWFQGKFELAGSMLAADGHDVFVAGLDSALEPTAGWRLGGPGDAEPTSLSLAADGVRVGGWFDIGLDGTTLSSAGNRDGFVARFDWDGQLRGSARIGRNEDDQVSCMARMPSGLWIAGHFRRHLSVNDQYLLSGSGEEDAFALSLSDW